MCCTILYSKYGLYVTHCIYQYYRQIIYTEAPLKADDMLHGTVTIHRHVLTDETEGISVHTVCTHV
jgi:hypothetical protein